MTLIAAPLLVDTDEAGLTTLVRGRTRVTLPTADLGRACTFLLDAFAPPGAEPSDVVDRMPETARPAMEALIGRLREVGLLHPPGPGGGTPEAVFWSDFGTTPDAVAEAAARLEIALVGRNPLSAAVEAALARAGMTVGRRIDDPRLANRGAMEGAEAGDWEAAEGFAFPEEAGAPPARLVIATTDIGAETWLRPWNEFCVAARVPFLPVSLKANCGHVGPYVRPGESACYECMRGRVNSNLFEAGVMRADEARRPEAPAAFGWHPALLDAVASAVTVEVLRQALGALPPQRPALAVLDPVGSGETHRHLVHRLPRCPVCSPAARRAAPLVVENEDRDAELIAAFK